MAKEIDYYLSLGSPWTYLGHPRLHEIAARHGAAVKHYPISMGIVFPQTGGLPLPKRSPQRQAYRLAELARWRNHLGATINSEPKYFPVPDADAARMVIAARRQGATVEPLAYAFMRAVWAEERDIADRDTLRAVADAAGFDGAALLAAGDDDPVQTEYEEDSQRAVERGVFGVPGYIYRDELFWGQDRLDFLERALAAG